MNKTVIIGLGVLIFGIVGIFGNFVQWRNSVSTNAKIVDSKEQVVVRGTDLHECRY